MKEFQNLIDRISNLKETNAISDAEYEYLMDNLNVINNILSNYKKDMLNSYQDGFKCALDSLTVAYESINKKINNY